MVNNTTKNALKLTILVSKFQYECDSIESFILAAKTIQNVRSSRHTVKSSHSQLVTRF